VLRFAICVPRSLSFLDFSIFFECAVDFIFSFSYFKVGEGRGAFPSLLSQPDEASRSGLSVVRIVYSAFPRPPGDFESLHIVSLFDRVSSLHVELFCREF